MKKMIKKIAYSLFALLKCSVTSWAVPQKEITIPIKLTDGPTLKAYFNHNPSSANLLLDTGVCAYIGTEFFKSHVVLLTSNIIVST